LTSETATLIVVINEDLLIHAQISMHQHRSEDKKKEDFMSFTVTDLAVTKLKEYLSQNNIESALRVALMQGG
jgi:hypothetical protein